MKFETKSERCKVAFVNIPFVTTWGAARVKLTAVRLIKEADGWRVDRADAVGGAWCPWEPATVEVFSTVRAAAKAARVWVRERKGSAAAL